MLFRESYWRTLSFNFGDSSSSANIHTLMHEFTGTSWNASFFRLLRGCFKHNQPPLVSLHFLPTRTIDDHRLQHQVCGEGKYVSPYMADGSLNAPARPCVGHLLVVCVSPLFPASKSKPWIPVLSRVKFVAVVGFGFWTWVCHVPAPSFLTFAMKTPTTNSTHLRREGVNRENYPRILENHVI